MRLVDDASDRCDAIVGQIVTSAPSVAVLHRLDALSQELCTPLDTLELARNVHPDASFVKAADAACGQLAARMHHLNADRRLYDAVKGVLRSPTVFSELSEEQVERLEGLGVVWDVLGA